MGDTLGKGQYGIVYACQDPTKVLKIHRCDEDEREAVERERSFLAGFPPHNDHTVHFFESFDHADGEALHPVFVMERMTTDLFSVLERGRLDRPAFGRYARQLCRAVHFLSESDIIHYDLKPENILIRDDTLKLCDFGTARPGDDGTTGIPSYGKTYEYRAPEVVFEYVRPTCSSDTFAVGCILFEMFVTLHTQRLPTASLFDPRHIFLGNLLTLELDDTEKVDYQHAYLFLEILGDMPWPYKRQSKSLAFDARGDLVGLKKEFGIERCSVEEYLVADGVDPSQAPDIATFLAPFFCWVPSERVCLRDVLDHPLLLA